MRRAVDRGIVFDMMYTGLEFNFWKFGCDSVDYLCNLTMYCVNNCGCVSDSVHDYSDVWVHWFSWYVVR